MDDIHASAPSSSNSISSGNAKSLDEHADSTAPSTPTLVVDYNSSHGNNGKRKRKGHVNSLTSAQTTTTSSTSAQVVSASSSDAEERRRKHSEIEQRRRERMNRHYMELDALCVRAEPSLVNMKRDRDVILVNAIRVLESLLNQVATLKANNSNGNTTTNNSSASSSSSSNSHHTHTTSLAALTIAPPRKEAASPVPSHFAAPTNNSSSSSALTPQHMPSNVAPITPAYTSPPDESKGPSPNPAMPRMDASTAFQLAHLQRQSAAVAAAAAAAANPLLHSILQQQQQQQHQQQQLTMLRHPALMLQQPPPPMMPDMDMSFYSQTRFGIASMLPNGLMRAANDSAIAMLGLRPEDLQVGPHQLSFAALIHPDDVAPMYQDMSQLLKRQQSSLQLNRRMRFRLGSFSSVNLLLLLQTDTTGSVVGFEFCFTPA